MFCPGEKNTDGGRASSDENKLDFPDPKQEVQQYFLVFRDDMKLCPKSVQRCEQCHLDFSSPDFLVIKTVGIRERTEKWGEKKIQWNCLHSFCSKVLEKL